MNITQVKDRTYCIDLGESNVVFYKINEKDIILIDTGAIDERETLETALQENNLNVKGIICSHGHPDHVASNQYLKEKYKCLIAAPMFEAQMCSSAAKLKAIYVNNTIKDINNIFNYMIFETDIYITDEQKELDLCGVNFNIFHTPGHSPSHICITTPDNVCYIADGLVSYEVIETAKVPYDFVMTEAIKSKEKLLSLKCDKYIVSHKGIFEDITKLVSDNIQFYTDKANKILELIKGKMTIDEIMKSVSESFELKTNNVFRYELISRLLMCHLDYLTETGKIKVVINEGYRKYVRTEDI